MNKKGKKDMHCDRQLLNIHVCNCGICVKKKSNQNTISSILWFTFKSQRQNSYCKNLKVQFWCFYFIQCADQMIFGVFTLSSVLIRWFLVFLLYPVCWSDDFLVEAGNSDYKNHTIWECSIWSTCFKSFLSY